MRESVNCTKFARIRNIKEQIYFCRNFKELSCTIYQILGTKFIFLKTLGSKITHMLNIRDQNFISPIFMHKIIFPYLASILSYQLPRQITRVVSVSILVQVQQKLRLHHHYRISHSLSSCSLFLVEFWFGGNSPYGNFHFSEIYLRKRFKILPNYLDLSFDYGI